MTQTKKVYIYAHTHWDREWYRTLEQYRVRLAEVIDLVLDQIEKNELHYFLLDGQAIIVEDYLKIRPRNKEKLIKLINQGKIEIGPWYVLPDEFLVSGESLIENLLIGHKTCDRYGIPNKIGYLPDTFGHSIDIPMILNKFNIDNAILWRGVDSHNSEFIWSSEDNSKVKTFHLSEGYYNDILHNQNTTITEKIELIDSFISKIKDYTTLNCFLMPVGGDHLHPPVNLQSLITIINAHQSDFELIQTTLPQFLEVINTELITEHIHHEFRDCSKTYILPAVASSRLYLKQHNAQLTNKINRQVEPFSAYCNTLSSEGFKIPGSSYLWKMLIENHPHDSICGCSIDEVHEEMEQRFKTLHQACDEILNRTKFSLIKHIPLGNIAIFNSSSYTYTGPSEVTCCHPLPENLISQKLDEFEDRHYRYYSDIKEGLPATVIKKQTKYLLWAENIPSNSLKTIEFSDIPNHVNENNGLLNNGLIEIGVSENSISVKDLQTGYELADLNQIISRMDRGDSYNFGPIKGYAPIKALIKEYEILETGPIRGKIRLSYELNIPESLNNMNNGPHTNYLNHKINCEISITANSKLIEFNLDWENKSSNHILQAVFPVSSDICTVLTENHFCTIERTFDPTYEIEENIPAKAYTEVKTNTAPAQRFIQACDIALFNEGLPEYEVSKNRLMLTLLRSTGYLSHKDVPTRGCEAGPNLATPGCQCIRQCKARYAIHPRTSISELYRLSEIFMGNTISIQGENEDIENNITENQLLNHDNDNVIISRFKYDDDTDNLTVHMLNITSFPQTVNLKSSLKIKNITEINMLKEPLSTISIDKELIFNPHELKALIINYK